MTTACPACSIASIAQDVATGSTQQFSLPTIHCAACIGKIERGLMTLNGVASVRVNLSLKRLTVVGPIRSDHILSALKSLGFEAYYLHQSEPKNAHDKIGRTLLTRMAVAGFAMMNVMLLSVAVWSGATDATRDLFHLISACITVPVIAFSGQPFFQNAWSALRVRRLNMDVPISLAILLATLMSLYESLNGGEHAYFDAALSLTFFLLIGRYLDHQTRSTARSAAKELTALEVHTTQRVIGTKTELIAVSAVNLNDQILVATGARIPVDGLLLSKIGYLDRSILTGESAASSVQEGDIVSAGEVNIGAPFLLKATAVGENTSLRRMAALVDIAENGRNRYTSLADRAAQIYAPAVHLLALFAFFGWFIITADVRHSLNIAIAVLIITCPCALGLAVPAVTTAAISRLFSMGFLVKHATALERLADVDHVVFDKTGTLTKASVPDLSKFSVKEKSISAALAQSSLHPLSRAVAASLRDETCAALTDVKEIAGQGIQARSDGTVVKLGRGSWLGATFSGLGLQIDGNPAKEITAVETIRDGVQDALEKIDLPCEILTGDANQPAEKIGIILGLQVTSDARPTDKLARLKQLDGAGKHTLMVGDGLNDTAALAAAHASIAPSQALEASRNAADIVLLKDSFSDLPVVLRIAKATQLLSKQNFAIAVLYNCIAVPFALAGFATPLAAALAMSLSSITVILNSQRMRYL
jgi:Cu2+-exporting ATPase